MEEAEGSNPSRSTNDGILGDMEASLVCSKDEIVARISRQPVEVDVESGATETPMIMWVNGHCMMWFRKTESDAWECEEL